MCDTFAPVGESASSVEVVVRFCAEFGGAPKMCAFYHTATHVIVKRFRPSEPDRKHHNQHHNHNISGASAGIVWRR